MVRAKSGEEAVKRWKMGMLTTPFIECPRCGKKTRSVVRCQWCKTVWTGEDKVKAEKRRLSLIPNLKGRI